MSDNPAQRAKVLTRRQLVETLECMNHFYTDAEHYAKFHAEIMAHDAAQRAALAAFPVAVWTKERPDKPGCYWWRSGTRLEIGQIWMTVHSGLRMVFMSGGRQYVAEMDGEWCPILPPQEGGGG